MITLDQLLTGTQGVLLHSKDKKFDAVGTDSRGDLTGKIFFPLKGDQFDGHDFIEKALASGASAVVSHKPPQTEEQKMATTWIQVKDTLVALQLFSQFWRAQWGGKLIGITGSNGKTTVKDFTHTLLTGTFSAIKNEGSFNNHWGLPLTLLRLRPEHQWGVVEMGMNHKGEISELVKLANPNVVTVTMVGTAHIENFGTIEGIAQAKEEIYENADKGGIAVFNRAQSLTQNMYDVWKEKFHQTRTFGTIESDVYFKIEEKLSKGLRISGKIHDQPGSADVLIWGEQNVHNLMAAATLALAAGVLPEHIWQRLALCEMGWGRNQWVPLKKGTVLFDGYNANPESFHALFANIGDLKKEYGKIIGVYGEMRELGAAAPEAHTELGRAAALSVIDSCTFFGPSEAFFRAGFESVKSGKNLITSDTYKEELAFEIRDVLDSQTLVVVKGSRGVQLERVVHALMPLNFKNY
jgi:UDP-N-acetylmuramoyl-tripeptide--D-alanyl-D-alanine ligase